MDSIVPCMIHSLQASKSNFCQTAQAFAIYRFASIRYKISSEETKNAIRLAGLDLGSALCDEIFYFDKGKMIEHQAAGT